MTQNPNATLPTLEADGKAYTSTTDVTAYLVQNAPKKVKAGNADFIKEIHEDSIDPNFALLLAVSIYYACPVAFLTRI